MARCGRACYLLFGDGLPMFALGLLKSTKARDRQVCEPLPSKLLPLRFVPNTSQQTKNFLPSLTCSLHTFVILLYYFLSWMNVICCAQIRHPLDKLNKHQVQDQVVADELTTRWIATSRGSIMVSHSTEQLVMNYQLTQHRPWEKAVFPDREQSDCPCRCRMVRNRC